MVNAVQIMHADGTLFERQGECDGCNRPGLRPGACCTYLELPLARALQPDEIRWAELHPGVNITGSGTYVRISVTCEALTPEGRCDLFGSPLRPALCERAPEMPGQVIAGCSYELKEMG